MKHSCLKFVLDKIQDNTMTEGIMEIQYIKIESLTVPPK